MSIQHFRRPASLTAFAGLSAALLLAAGCTSLIKESDWSAVTRRTEARFGNSLALVKLQSESSAENRTQIAPGITLNLGSGRAPDFAGLILSTNGFVLVPELLKPDLEDRIEVWIGNTSYPAHPVKSDDALGMSIIRIEADERFTPANLAQVADLHAGEPAMALVPTGEEADFQLLTSLVQCRGEIGGRYRRFALSGLPREARGALVFNRDGVPVGIVAGGDALALSDLREDLSEFLSAATGARSATEEEKQKGWIGVYLEPINKELAKARQLPESGLWVVHVAADGPAHAAGLLEGDLITAVNGQALKFTGSRAREFFTKTLRPRAGAPFTITAIRGGAPRTLRGTFAKRPEPVTLRAEDLGITVQALCDSDVFTENLSTGAGVMVTDVSRGSAAATGSSMRQSLLMKKDVIVELGTTPTPTIEAFSRALEAVRKQKTPAVLVKFRRGDVTGYAGLNLKIGEKDSGGRE